MTNDNDRLSQQQQSIRDYGSGNLVVVAGAGTGKTETLTQRVLHLLTAGVAQRPCELHQLIALTFTDKAAAEMRQRVYQSLLNDLSSATGEEQRERLARLRAGFADHNRIGTFDSFNHRLLALYPEQAQVPLGFEPLSDYDARDLKMQLRAAFWNYADTLQSHERDDLLDLLERFSKRELLALLDQLAADETPVLEALQKEIEPAQVESELRALTSEANRRVQRRLRREMEHWWRQYVESLPPHLPENLVDVLTDESRLRLSQSSEVLKKQKKAEFTQKFIKQCPPDLLIELESALPALARWRVLELKSVESIAALEITPQSLQFDVESRQVLRSLASLALWWKAARQELCRQNRWVDFVEMQRAAVRLLGDPALCDKLRAANRHILVDEFQDTNLEQWGIIDRLRGADNVLVVGDEKQAIYGFRGGDITAFDEVRRILIGDTEPLSLVRSYRSTKPIIDFCNRLFAHLLPTGDEREPHEAPFQELQAADAESPITAGVWALRPPQEDETPAAPLAGETGSDRIRERARAAESVADLLFEIQSDAESDAIGKLRRPEFAAISEAIRNGEQGVVALLCRTHAVKAIYEAALQRRGVRCASVKGIGFFQSEQVRDALNLINFLLDPDDSLALAGILRSPLGALSDAGLLGLRIHDPQQSLWRALGSLFVGNGSTPDWEEVFAHAPDRRAARLAYQRLSQWRHLARLRSISAVLDAILQETELVFFDAGLPDARQRAENWRKLIDVVRDRETRGHGGLRELAEYLAAQTEEQPKESDAALPDGGAIQLMTIYAAKGLGFAMVIVAQMDDDPPRDSFTRLRRGTFPDRDHVHWCLKVQDEDSEKQCPVLWKILEQESVAREQAEFRRLLYVACTRAKEHLILVVPQNRKDGSWGEMAAPFCADVPDINCVAAADAEVERASSDAASAQSFEFDPNLLRPLAGNVFPLEVTVAELLAQNASAPQRLTRRQLAAVQQWIAGNGWDAASIRHQAPFSISLDVLRHLLPGDRDGALWVNGMIDFLVPIPDGLFTTWAVLTVKSDMDADVESAEYCLYRQEARIHAAAAAHLRLTVGESRLLMVDEDGNVRALRLDE